MITATSSITVITKREPEVKVAGPKVVFKTPRRAPQPAGERPVPRWITSYADFISLIAVFFVLLFSMSTTNKIKYEASVKSLQETMLSKKQQETIKATDYAKLLQVKQQLDAQIRGSNLASFVTTGVDNTGIQVRVKDSLFFQSGEATLLETAYPILNGIAQAMSNKDYQIVVEGHTDDIPITTPQYPSNWELSSARASSVIKYFINTGYIKAGNLAATGFANNRPLVANDSDEDRAKNRRVEIRIMEKRQ